MKKRIVICADGTWNRPEKDLKKDYFLKGKKSFESHLVKDISNNPLATLHNSRRSFYRVKRKYFRPIRHKKGGVLIHESVKVRWEKDLKYRPKNLRKYVEEFGWEGVVGK
ncbi:MAG: hypothetical protein PF574_03180 [Candidatus Delongbacteria bacterium]|jgi:hypothetical protein|nr:hypothetical protein [Candidatus Delongbacteria bacterium]